ncbi:hypothetical protein [Ulvibacterium sp.]|uniref:Ig-like domain-containing protein n=1 Tax=Ulvibacterium sp. TaxID=2665914 RepID=UPI0026323AC5|nr:hypothetical protein [Ulvibacterium sp.]
MRLVGRSVLFLLLIFPAVQVLGQDTYLDNFNTVSYSNNNGTLNYSTNWVEANDNNNPSSGRIRITGNELRFEDISTNNRRITRSADLSAHSSAILTFDWQTSGLDGGSSGEQLNIQVSNNGTSFTTIGTFTGSQSGSFTQDISAYISAFTTIRFINVGTCSYCNWESGEFVYIDNVQIEVPSSNAAPVLTGTGNQTYCPGSSLPIAETIGITDVDDTSTNAVYIQISSGYVNGEDLLTLTGTHPNITSSWDAVQGELTLSGPAPYTEFETAILAVEYSSSAANPTGTRQFSITVGEANYLPATGHYYEYVPNLGITWTAANTAASARTYFGLQGYLATLTSQAEADFSGSQAVGVGWIGGSDAATEGVWQWVTGPEAGTVFWNGTAGGSTPNFAFWNTGEPNQSGNEDYAHITHPNVNPNGSWNDLSNTGAASGNYQPQGYVVEYGGTPGDPVLNITVITTITIEPIPTITSTTPGSRCGPGTVTLGATASAGTINWYASAVGGSSLGTGTSFVTPSISSTTTYYVDATSSGCTTAARTAITATVNTGPSITSQPVNSTICPGCSTTFTVTTLNVDTYQWQLFNGFSWVDLTDTGIYSGTTTNTLTVTNAAPTDNGNQYRVQVSNSALPCSAVASTIAVLTVNVSEIITNRRITYRVDKN